MDNSNPLFQRASQQIGVCVQYSVFEHYENTHIRTIQLEIIQSNVTLLETLLHWQIA